MSRVEEVVIAYVAAWNEEDEEKRRALLARSWAEEGVYVDPRVEVVGREALVQHIGRVQQRSADQHIVFTSGFDEHHGWIRFTWARIDAEGKRFYEGIDFGEINADGYLIRITGFFGPPLPIPASWPANLVM